MKLNYITIMVRDIQKSIAFYSELVGLKIQSRFKPNEIGEIAFMVNEEGETMLELIEFKDVEKVSAIGMVMSYTSAEPLNTLQKKAADLGYNPTEIIYSNPKPAHFRVTDPDGIVVEFSNK